MTDYKQDLIAILRQAGIPDERTSSSGAISHPLIEVLAAIDRLNAAAIGEDEEGGQCPCGEHVYDNPVSGANQLRSELRRAFGIANKEEEK